MDGMETTSRKNKKSLVDHDRLLLLLQRLRPEGVPRELMPAYTAFEVLLSRLLLDGDGDARLSVDQMIEELADAEVRSAAVYYATQLSFFSAVTVALHEGPVDWGDPTHGKQLWPPAVKDPDALRTVKLFGMLLVQGVLEMAKRPASARRLREIRAALVRGKPPPRSKLQKPIRGAPPKLVLGGVARLIVRQRCVPGERTPSGKVRPHFKEAQLLNLVVRASKKTTSPWKIDNLRKRVMRERRVHPVPTTYLGTLVAQRLSPLIVQDFADRSPFVRWFAGVLPERRR
ncbi:MAG: hypothetical protein KC657_10725 [Myxococcales bacterium]|nr:hypothetical protein [Myxococcales bacterium]